MRERGRKKKKIVIHNQLHSFPTSANSICFPTTLNILDNVRMCEEEPNITFFNACCTSTLESWKQSCIHHDFSPLEFVLLRKEESVSCAA